MNELDHVRQEVQVAGDYVYGIQEEYLPPNGVFEPVCLPALFLFDLPVTCSHSLPSQPTKRAAADSPFGKLDMSEDLLRAWDLGSMDQLRARAPRVDKPRHFSDRVSLFIGNKMSVR